jgi:acyl-CoA synthetase (AMP-forming)/AMP-acid ligase II
MQFLGDIIRKNAKKHANKVGLIYGDRELTFGEISRNVHQLANAMLDLGIAKGDHVAILSKNCPEYLEFYFASAMIGAIPVGINYRLVDEEVEFIANDAEARLLVVNAEYEHTILAIRDNLVAEHYISLEGKIDGMLEYESVIASASDTKPDIALDENDVAMQMYTSGTTGRPKGAMLSHRNILSCLIGTTLSAEATVNSRFFSPTPFYHMSGVLSCLIPWNLAATAAVARDFIPAECLQTIQDLKITHTVLVPAMVIFCLQVPGVEKFDFSSLEAVLAGASPFPLQPLKRAIEVFGCKFGQVFGQTESAGIMTFLGPEDHIIEANERRERILKSAGKEIWHNEVRVVDEEGNDVRPGEVGEVIGRGPNNMVGYWNLPEATAEALKDGWLYTGDLATFDEEGYLYIIDRKKDMIISGAENIYPAEIEAVLMTHPAIAEAAVIGIPHESWGESVKAIIVMKEGAQATTDEIVDFCRKHLAGYKIPRSVDFADALPRNPTGKILKTVLREKYWEGHEKRVH